MIARDCLALVLPLRNLMRLGDFRVLLKRLSGNAHREHGVLRGRLSVNAGWWPSSLPRLGGTHIAALAAGGTSSRDMRRAAWLLLHSHGFCGLTDRQPLRCIRCERCRAASPLPCCLARARPACTRFGNPATFKLRERAEDVNLQATLRRRRVDGFAQADNDTLNAVSSSRVRIGCRRLTDPEWEALRLTFAGDTGATIWPRERGAKQPIETREFMTLVIIFGPPAVGKMTVAWSWNASQGFGCFPIT